MSSIHRRFLPDRLRPRAQRQRSRHRLLLAMAVAVALMLLLASGWEIQTVEVIGADVVPASVLDSFHGLVGHAVPFLDLEWARRLAATWPAAGEIQLRLELPGTLIVEIFPEAVRGSVAMGRGWHAVAADGRLAGHLDGPVSPRLVDFRRPTDRRLAFAVACRVAGESGGQVVEVRQVTPDDYRVELQLGDDRRVVVAHVDPQGTDAERAWCQLVATDGAVIEWADLRWPHRLVLREVGS
jgi:hypothetical protein